MTSTHSIDSFLQIHALTAQSGVLLNRDDMGNAKRLDLGGVSRTRVSSQCAKRHWRTTEDDKSLANLGPLAVRSRLTFETMIIQPLLEKKLYDESMVRETVDALAISVLGESLKAKKEKERDANSEEEPKKTKGKSKKEEGQEFEPMQTNQVVVLGRPEVAYLLRLAEDICRDLKGKGSSEKPKAAVEARRGDIKKNLQALSRGAGLDAALFGRMVTSDVLANTDAAICVAHAFTVHGEQSDSDYFAAVDDLVSEGGSGHINSTELTSGLFYHYVVVDLKLLLSNLSGGKTLANASAEDVVLAQSVISSLLHLVATVSPGAKKGSTAPFSHAHMLLCERGRAQPCSLASAFLNPVSVRPDVIGNTYKAIASHLTAHEGMYGVLNQRKISGMFLPEALTALTGPAVSLKALSSWASEAFNRG